MRYLLAFAFLSALLPLSSRATANPDDSTYKPMPWHLIDVWWNLDSAVEFNSYSIDVEISDDVPSDVNLYIAPIGLGHLNDIAFYGGLQTRVDGTTKKDPKLKQIGPGCLFSMWGERSFDAIRPADGGYCQSSGHEGDFVSVRRPYRWKKGTYTYRLVRMDQEVVNGSAATWVGAFVYSHERDENIFIGALRFKGDKLVLAKSIASFVEVYGERRPVADIPKITITFGNLRINGEPASIKGASANYPKNVPDYADAVGHEGAVTIRVGNPTPPREKREVELLGK